MIKLTPRMNAIAGEVLAGESVADIGTDHGFLPLWLWEKGISEKIILADISKGSLNKARENCKSLFPSTDFDLRLGSGFEVLDSGEVDVAIIAGMGGILMTEIIGKNIDKSRSFKKLILQPRNNIGFLRHWLYNHSFSIINEQLVREGKYICEIITVIPKEVAITNDMGSDCIEYEFPHSLIDFKNDLTLEYLKRHLEQEQFILDAIKNSKNIDLLKVRKQEYRISYLNYLINQC